MAKCDRGFASMDKDKGRAIASLGGKAAHAAGTAHQWTISTAQAAGRKGGLASAAKRKQKEQDACELAAEGGSD